VTLERSFCENEAVQIALTLFPGVSADECEAFTLAFSHLADCELVGVGATVGEVVGPGGRQHVDATYAQVTHPDVVLVPGGLGVDRTAHDEELVAWLRRVEPTCHWMAASSTGTVVVAAAGLLNDRPAATHWLAGRMLAEYGSAASAERIVEVGHVITCHGRISAMDVALLMIIRLYNREVAATVRAEIAGPVRLPSPATPTWRRRIAASPRWRALVRSRRPYGRRAPRNEELDVSPWIEMELVEEGRDRRS
jgi:putative intracellular protease/amidase